MSATMKPDINTLIAGQRDGYSLEQAFYRCADIFQHDMDRLISQRWLLVDHESRIPNSGDYFLFEIGNESIIIIRNSENEVNAFFNVCRHRGSRICLENQGNKGLLTCPYHAWTYDLNGELRPPRLMPADFDRTQFNLHACHVRVFHGLVFICLAAGDAPDFDEVYAGFDETVAFHGFENAKIAVKRDYPNACNWKLVVENFIECYHCAPAHAEYCAVHPEDQLLALGAGPGSGPPEALAAYEEEWNAWKEKARALGHPVPEIEQDEHSTHMAQLSRLPINDRDFASETRDGSPACKLMMGSFEQCDHGESAMVFNPLSYILAFNDFALMTRFTPRDAVRTDVQMSWLVHRDAREGVDYDPDKLTWVWDTTIRQDKKITEDNNAGIASSRYQPGPYSEQEAMVAQFIRWYLHGIS